MRGSTQLSRKAADPVDRVFGEALTRSASARSVSRAAAMSPPEIGKLVAVGEFLEFGEKVVIQRRGARSEQSGCGPIWVLSGVRSGDT